MLVLLHVVKEEAFYCMFVSLYYIQIIKRKAIKDKITCFILIKWNSINVKSHLELVFILQHGSEPLVETDLAHGQHVKQEHVLVCQNLTQQWLKYTTPPNTFLSIQTESINGFICYTDQHHFRMFTYKKIHNQYLKKFWFKYQEHSSSQQEGPEGPGLLTSGKGQRSQWSHL